MLINEKISKLLADTYKMLVKTQSKRGFQKWLADALGIKPPLLSMIINDKRSLSVDIASKLQEKTDVPMIFWLNMPILKLDVCLWELFKDDYEKHLNEIQTEKE